MSKYIVDIHGDIEGDYEIIGKYLEPKTGHWINKKCSACGCRSMLGLCIENYCANCGAKMEEEKDDEEDVEGLERNARTGGST